MHPRRASGGSERRGHFASFAGRTEIGSKYCEREEQIVCN